MIYQSTENNSTLQIKVIGPITDGRAQSLKECFEEVLYSNKPFVEFDFSDVPFITSKYIGEFNLLSQQLTKRRRELVLKSVQNHLYLLFESQNLHKVINYEK